MVVKCDPVLMCGCDVLLLCVGGDPNSCPHTHLDSCVCSTHHTLCGKEQRVLGACLRAQVVNMWGYSLGCTSGIRAWSTC